MPESAPTVHQLVEEAERVQSGHDPGPDPDRAPSHGGEEDRGAVPPPDGDGGDDDGVDDREGDDQTQDPDHPPHEPAVCVFREEVMHHAGGGSPKRDPEYCCEEHFFLEREGGGRGLGDVAHVVLCVGGRFPTEKNSNELDFCQGTQRFLDVAEQVVLSLVQL